MRDLGLLILRIGIGFMFILHGWPKLFGGMAKWEKLGAKMSLLGLDFAPAFWGLCASLAEILGGLFIALGILFKPSSLLLAFTMLIATLYHLDAGDGIMGSSHAIESMILFVSLYFIGAGKDRLFKNKSPLN
jgi:putative oxidoreductase